MLTGTSKVCVLGSVALVTDSWGMNREAQWLEKVMELRCSVQLGFWGRLVGFGRSVAALSSCFRLLWAHWAKEHKQHIPMDG